MGGKVGLVVLGHPRLPDDMAQELLRVAAPLQQIAPQGEVQRACRLIQAVRPDRLPERSVMPEENFLPVLIDGLEHPESRQRLDLGDGNDLDHRVRIHGRDDCVAGTGSDRGCHGHGGESSEGLPAHTGPGAGNSRSRQLGRRAQPRPCADDECVRPLPQPIIGISGTGTRG